MRENTTDIVKLNTWNFKIAFTRNLQALIRSDNMCVATCCYCCHYGSVKTTYMVQPPIHFAWDKLAFYTASASSEDVFSSVFSSCVSMTGQMKHPSQAMHLSSYTCDLQCVIVIIVCLQNSNQPQLFALGASHCSDADSTSLCSQAAPMTGFGGKILPNVNPPEVCDSFRLHSEAYQQGPSTKPRP